MQYTVLVVLGGCAMSPKQVDDLRGSAASGNEQRAAQAIQRWRTDHSGAAEVQLDAIELYRPGQGQARPEVAVGEAVAAPAGLLGTEHVWRDPRSQHLMFDLDHEFGCGSTPITNGYSYYREPAGQVVIVRLAPDVHERRVHVASCGYGCGTMQVEDPTRPHAAIDLGITDPAQLAIAELRYRYDVVTEECDHPIAAP